MLKYVSPSFLSESSSDATLQRDVLALDETEDVAGEFEWVLTPGKNEFKSERLEVAEFDYRVIAQTNWGVWGIKGKRYVFFLRLLVVM